MLDFRDYRVIDLSVRLEEGYPLTWPSMPLIQKRTLNWYARVDGPHGQPLIPSIGAFYAQALSIDEHTGTHVDFPPHNIPSSDSGLPNAGAAGDRPGDEYPLEHLIGPAAVVDLTSLLDQAPAGVSPAITPETLEHWEDQHGRIEPGEIVLLNSGYCDKYFAPLPREIGCSSPYWAVKFQAGQRLQRRPLSFFMRGVSTTSALQRQASEQSRIWEQRTWPVYRGGCPLRKCSKFERGACTWGLVRYAAAPHRRPERRPRPGDCPDSEDAEHRQ